MAQRTNVAKEPAPAAADLLDGVILYLQSDGASDAMTLYERAFGAKQASRTDHRRRQVAEELPGGINGDLVMVIDGMPEHGFPFHPSHSFTLQLFVDDDDEAWLDRAVAAGCAVWTPMQKIVWDDRRGAVVDPFQIRRMFEKPGQGAAS